VISKDQFSAEMRAMPLQELELATRKAWSLAAEVRTATILAYGFSLVGLPQLSTNQVHAKITEETVNKKKEN
jgi:hypothetical protein